MPSFDIVSEVDKQELANAVDNTLRESANRFDLKSTKATIESPEHDLIQVIAENEFQCHQLFDVLKVKIAQRGISVDCLKTLEPQTNISEFRLPVSILQGIEHDLAKKINRLVKESKFKVQCHIQKDQVRISGKKKNDLQALIKIIKNTDFAYPLQFKNFRD